MVSAVYFSLSGPGWALAGNIVLCSRAGHFTVIVPLSTQLYKWLPASLMVGAALRWTSIPSGGGGGGGGSG